MARADRAAVTASVGGVAYVAGLLVAGSLLLSAGAKWRDPAGTARGFRDLGVPRPWSVARALPPIEALLAVGLVALGWPAALAATVLLALFTGFLGRRVRDGARAPCQCFGAWSRHPLSRADVVRTSLLTAAAAAATAGGPRWPSPAELAVVAALAVGGAGLTRGLRRRSAAG